MSKFSFKFDTKGATSGASSNSSTTPPAASSAAPATTPAFSFNLTKTNSNTTKAAADQPVVIPPELKNKSIKEIIEMMESQLEQQDRQFHSQARQIARWDRSIRDIMDLMMFLDTEIKTVENKQKELLEAASSVLQDQNSFLKTLRDKIPSKQGEDLLASSDQRAKLYRTAGILGEDFHKMESQLKDIVEKTENNESQDSISDIDKVVQISNCHLDSLQWISNYCTSIEEKLNAIESQINESSMND